jgi:hypothetical protein
MILWRASFLQEIIRAFGRTSESIERWSDRFQIAGFSCELNPKFAATRTHGYNNVFVTQGSPFAIAVFN